MPKSVRDARVARGQQSAPAKITAPRLVDEFPRERLFVELDQKRRYPTIWINGPPGPGKTPLTASYLGNCKVPALWYQIDEDDSDFATCFYYLGLAGKKAAPRKRKLPLFTPEYTLAVSAFTRNFFEASFNHLKNPAALVLANYQEVSPPSPIHEVVREMLSDDFFYARFFGLVGRGSSSAPGPFAKQENSDRINRIDRMIAPIPGGREHHKNPYPLG